MDKRLRELEEEQRRLMEQMEKNESKNKYKYKSAEKHESNILLQFVIRTSAAGRRTVLDIPVS